MPMNFNFLQYKYAVSLITTDNRKFKKNEENSKPNKRTSGLSRYLNLLCSQHIYTIFYSACSNNCTTVRYKRILSYYLMKFYK